MKLAASLIVKDERARYLEPCVEHLLEFCDEVRILDDGSTDNVVGLYARTRRVAVRRRSAPAMFAHEGRARQELLEWTLAAEPTHVLAIDADEFVSDGVALRAQLTMNPALPVWSLQVEEVWCADSVGLCVREDGGWRSHPLPCLWLAPECADASWQITQRQLACPRVPAPVLARAPAGRATGCELLHFGWADERARAARHARYLEHDQGRYHAGSHLASILWPAERVKLRARDWPAGLERWRPTLVERAGAEAAT